MFDVIIFNEKNQSAKLYDNFKVKILSHMDKSLEENAKKWKCSL